ncbi:MAG: fused MFS/spermidine synthase [Bryobacteraceae bacterium]|nr:fused MFS/spermidine synthase [Bryobacteraceae bacterium]
MPNAFRRWLYGTVVFVSALLLLLVQPVITKAILPWFGGSAGVWTTSMLFFQLVLLLGYLYAHLITRTLAVRTQTILHIALLVLASLLLPIRPSEQWKPSGEGDPAGHILGLLFASAGLPYFLLSATSPLLQSWYSRTLQTGLPWRLFAVSNLGSLIALLCYPVLIEPQLTVRQQLGWWSAGFGGFAALCSVAAIVTGRGVAVADAVTLATPGKQILTWLALAIVPSALWLAVASQISQDVAAVPFLWILPLSIYLISFVLTFDSSRWYSPRVYRWILPLSWIAFVALAGQQGHIKLEYTIALYALALLLCCMFCHGELARLKPDTGQLTLYYLTISAGGALGGLFVGLVAPKLFDRYLELPVAMLACVVLALWLLYRVSNQRVIRIAVVSAAGAVAATFVNSSKLNYEIHLRNFYGTLLVEEETQDNKEKIRTLYNGTIQHGLQFVSAAKSRIATTYYGPASGAALALRELEQRGPVRLGVIGLGAGTMAAYSRPHDYVRFYDINPLVIQLARTEFRYLRESQGKTDVVPGDARLSLERETPQNFSLLVVDAFSGDSIPIHLLTREAFTLYFRHIAPGGAIAVHVTNKHLQLAPVVKKLAGDQRAHSRLIINTSEEERKIYDSDWVIVTKDNELDSRLAYLSSPIKGSEPLRLWTDDYSNLFSILKANR